MSRRLRGMPGKTCPVCILPDGLYNTVHSEQTECLLKWAALHCIFIYVQHHTAHRKQTVYLYNWASLHTWQTILLSCLYLIRWLIQYSLLRTDRVSVKWAALFTASWRAVSKYTYFNVHSKMLKNSALYSYSSLYCYTGYRKCPPYTVIMGYMVIRDTRVNKDRNVSLKPKSKVKYNYLEDALMQG